MKLLSILIALAFIVPAMAIALAPASADGAGTDAGLNQVAVFGNGTRYEAGSYHVVVLSGTYREMGRQFGALMKDELKEEYAMLRSHFTASGYTDAEVGAFAQKATALQAKRMKEIRAGIAETSGLSAAEVDVLYEGPIVYLTTFGAKAGCSFMAVWGNYTQDGSVVLSRNYDLPDVFSVFYPYYTLTVYNPTDGSNGVATFGPAGARPETLMNSAGLFIADDNAVDSGSTLEIAGRPDLIGEFFKSVAKSREKIDLLIFLTPQILETPEEATKLTADIGAASGDVESQLTELERLYKQKNDALYRQGVKNQ